MKYNKRDSFGLSKRRAKCGHISHQGRWRICEKCMPVLPEDTGDLIYFQPEDDLESVIELNGKK
jgi:hypothetical protein